ncbi:MAG: hypothetical protein Q8O22_04035 [Candidatus Omnitrophota bacterium]|nr:hypothetical protein [Candidatus Omnitrophota bacterium]
MVLAFVSPRPVFSEVIRLKSGKTVEGKAIERTDKYIKIDFYNVPMTYYFSEIQAIDGKEPEAVGVNAGAKVEAPGNYKSIEIDDAFLGKVFDYIKKESGEPKKYYAAASICSALISAAKMQEIGGEEQFIKPPATELLKANASLLVESGAAGFRKAIAGSLKEAYLDSAVFDLMRANAVDFKELISELDMAAVQDSDNALPLYLKAVAFEYKKNYEEARKNIKEALDKTISLNISKNYAAMHEFLISSGYGDIAAAETAAMLAKCIGSLYIFEINISLFNYIREDKMEKDLFGRWRSNAVEYNEDALIAAKQLALARPQSFMAETMGLTLEGAACFRLIDLYKKQGEEEKAGQMRQKANDLQYSVINLKRRFVDMLRNFSNLQGTPQAVDFLVDSVTIGEEQAANKYFGNKN